MDQLKNYYKEMGVDEKVFDYAQEVEKGLKDRFETLDAIAQLNQIQVLPEPMENGQQKRSAQRDRHFLQRSVLEL